VGSGPTDTNKTKRVCQRKNRRNVVKTLANLVKKRKEKKKKMLVGDITFLAAALKASLWDISGFTDLMRWISSLQRFIDGPFTVLLSNLANL
jgi:hypothetical protein